MENKITMTMKMRATIETLYDQLGGMGRFQVMTSLLIALCQVPVGWSMLQMTFAGVIPEFRCLVKGINYDEVNKSVLIQGNDKSIDVCSMNGTSCDSYLYDTTAVSVITEWDLVCDLKWVKKVIISIQMAGVLVGTLIAGQCSDVLGRKKVLYSFVLAHFILNVVAAVSVNWVMFSCMRFFIGLCLGAIIVVVCPFQMEFVTVRWRPLMGIIPSFTLGLAIFAAAAALLEDWTHLHYACAVLTLISLVGVLYVPESPRWLAVVGKTQEAEEVFKRIAAMNKKPIPENTVRVLQSLQSNDVSSGIWNYTYVDLFRTRYLAKISLVFFYYWFILAVVYYGISFGIGSLSGNLYLNIFLLGVMEIPVQTTTFFLNNKIGRRKTTFTFLVFSFVPLFLCLVFHETTSGSTEGVSLTVLSLVAKMMVGAAWSNIQVWGTELFPTVTRNLGCGFSSLGARVGGILAPFIIDLDEMLTLSYAILCVLLAIGMVLSFFIPETMGTSLNDTNKRLSNSLSSEERNHEEICIELVKELDRVDNSGGEKEASLENLNLTKV